MFCPQCGSTPSDELRFCKACGANLYAVRQVVATRDTDKFDWSKTWLSEMFLSQEERKRRELELERQQGITPEVKRYNEIKAGVITASVGVGVAIFLYVFMQGIILGGKVDPDEAAIISRLWISGVIPFFVGLGLLINGVYVSKKMVQTIGQNSLPGERLLQKKGKGSPLQSPGASELAPSCISVTEETTQHLASPRPKPTGPNQ